MNDDQHSDRTQHLPSYHKMFTLLLLHFLKRSQLQDLLIRKYSFLTLGENERGSNTAKSITQN